MADHPKLDQELTFPAWCNFCGFNQDVVPVLLLGLHPFLRSSDTFFCFVLHILVWISIKILDSHMPRCMKIEYGRNKIIGRGVLLTYIDYSGCFNSKQEKYEFVGLSAVLFDEGRKETVLSACGCCNIDSRAQTYTKSQQWLGQQLCIDPESIWWVSHGPWGQHYLVPHINTPAWSELTQLFVVGHRSNTSELGSIRQKQRYHGVQNCGGHHVCLCYTAAWSCTAERGGFGS